MSGTQLRRDWARRLVSIPECSEPDPEMKKPYCDGCFVTFDTAIEQTAVRATG